MVSRFCFNNGEKILAVYKLTDQTISTEMTEEEKVKRQQKMFVLARSEQELNIRKPKIDTCILVTNYNVYKINLT